MSPAWSQSRRQISKPLEALQKQYSLAIKNMDFRARFLLFEPWFIKFAVTFVDIFSSSNSSLKTNFCFLLEWYSWLKEPYIRNIYKTVWHEINAKKNILKAAKEIICNLGLYWKCKYILIKGNLNLIFFSCKLLIVYFSNNDWVLLFGWTPRRAVSKTKPLSTCSLPFIRQTLNTELSHRMADDVCNMEN